MQQEVDWAPNKLLGPGTVGEQVANRAKRHIAYSSKRSVPPLAKANNKMRSWSTIQSSIVVPKTNCTCKGNRLIT